MKIQTCSQSSNRLVEPIVACELGNLFNKEELLSALIDKKLNPAFSHIRGLKDIKTLLFCANPNYDASLELEGECPAQFVCPVTQIEFNGMLPFVVIWNTGYVLSEKAIKEVGLESLQGEFGPFTLEDIVKLAPSEDEVSQQREAMEARRSKRKLASSSSSKKRSVVESTGENGETTNKIKSKKVEANNNNTSSSVNNSSAPLKLTTSSSVAKSAAKEIQQQNESSAIYQKLFHKDLEGDKKGRDLFMSVAGIRYTVT